MLVAATDSRRNVGAWQVGRDMSSRVATNIRAEHGVRRSVVAKLVHESALLLIY